MTSEVSSLSSLKGPSPEMQRVQSRGEAVHVGRLGRPLSFDDLGRSVRHRGGDHAASRLVRSLDARDAEVAELGLAVLRHEDVLGLDVAVEHPRFVRRIERPGDLDRRGGRVVPRHRALLGQTIAERAPRHELHDDVGLLVVGEPGAVHGDDVRMARERAHRHALTLEPVPRRLVGGSDREDLQGDSALEAGLVRLVDDTEAAATDLDGILEAGDGDGSRRPSPRSRIRHPQPLCSVNAPDGAADHTDDPHPVMGTARAPALCSTCADAGGMPARRRG